MWTYIQSNSLKGEYVCKLTSKCHFRLNRAASVSSQLLTADPRIKAKRCHTVTSVV